MAFGVIYVATNTVTGKQYVGLTRMSVAIRWAQHVGKARNPKTYFHRAIAKYGATSFTVVEYTSAISKDALALLEKAIILQLAPAYNQTNGGEVTFGRKYDDAAKERIRLASTGRNWTDAQKQRMSTLKKAQYEGRPELAVVSAGHLAGMRHLWEEKRVTRVKETATARVWSEAAKAKLSASCMGRRYDASVIARMAESKKRKICCDTTGVVYACRKTAATACNVGERSILRVCGGEYPSVKGLKFSYVE